MKTLRLMFVTAILLALAGVHAAARHKHSKKCYRRGGHAYVGTTFQFGKRSCHDRDYRYRRNRRDRATTTTATIDAHATTARHAERSTTMPS